MNEFINIFNNIWVSGLFGVSITQIIVAISIMLLSFLCRAFFIRRVITWLDKLTENTESNFDDAVLDSLERPLGYVPIVIGLYILTIYLPVSGNMGEFGSNLVEALVAFTIFSALMNTVNPVFGVLSSSTWLTPSMSMWLERAVRMILGIICLAIILDIFGIEIGPLVAGLGLFSVAVALGAQDLFKNLIAGILIIGENRFQPGDRIEVIGEMHGMVEEIGFRSTTIRLFNTSPMVIPNKDLSDVKVINHGEMIYRRLNWKINLVYSTTVEQLSKICADIETYMKHSDDIAENPGQECLARAVEFGASSIDVQILCYTAPVSLTEFTAIKQNLIYEIMNVVRGNGSEFAYPSTSLYVESTPESVDNAIPEVTKEKPA